MFLREYIPANSHEGNFQFRLRQNTTPESRFAITGSAGITSTRTWVSNPTLATALQLIDPVPRGYERGNVVWAKGRPGIPITHEGRTQSVAAWARELGIKEGTLRARLKKAMPVAGGPPNALFRGNRAPLTLEGDRPQQPPATMKELESLRNFCDSSDHGPDSENTAQATGAA